MVKIVSCPCCLSQREARSCDITRWCKTAVASVGQSPFLAWDGPPSPFQQIEKDQNLTFLHLLERDASSLPTALFSFTLRSERWLPDWLYIKPASLQPTSVYTLSCLCFLKWFYLKSVQKASDTVCTCRHWVPKIRPQSSFSERFSHLNSSRLLLKEYAIGIQFKVKWKEKWRLK